MSVPSKDAIHQEAVQAAVEALGAHPWNSYPHAAHREHNFDSACMVCRADLEPIARVILEAAAPAITAQVLRGLLAAAKSCTICGEIHQRRPATRDDGISYMSWGHPEDGHAYFQASQEAAAWLARQIGEARDTR
ncbi:hypothetical protein ACGFNP_25400 [Nonomuraea sp. NPDC049269]|uniref:hypothetical protein n=1 Tax=Nonomuraea sp. NPDC049269 TaxID=3364349 RepID=UPI00371BB897